MDLTTTPLNHTISHSKESLKVQDIQNFQAIRSHRDQVRRVKPILQFPEDPSKKKTILSTNMPTPKRIKNYFSPQNQRFRQQSIQK
jgi:hypothetical protein